MKNKFFNKDYLKHAIRQYKFFGITTCIVLIVLGILMFCFPLVSHAIAIWTFVIALCLAGFFDFFAYLFGNKDNQKSSLVLLKAIFNIIISLVILIPLIVNTVQFGFLEAIKQSTLEILSWIVAVVGIYLIFTGIGKIIRSEAIGFLGGSKVIEITVGIIYIILGILFCINPIVKTVSFITYVLAIYLICYGVILFIELVTNPTIRDYSKPFTPKKAKENSSNEQVIGEVIDNNTLKK